SAHSWAQRVVGGAVREQYRSVSDLYRVSLPPGMSVAEAVQRCQRDPDVLYAEPDYVVEAQLGPDDPSFRQQYGLTAISAPQAWDVTTGSSSVVVAVIDTGIDYVHPDLAANVWRNEPDCNGDGVDDDGNGYVDDCHGIDVANDDSDPFDDNAHGSHVSGIIGAVANNGIGVAGVNWDVGILACKFLNSEGSGSTSGALRCLDYVKMMKERGVPIVATNNSWGGGGYSQALADAIDAQRAAGILFIAAAGNASFDNGLSPFYPATYERPNLISVAATTASDALAGFSNFGRTTVHLGAPGAQVLSTTPFSTYQSFSGTSMATPHVTGVAEMLKAADPVRDWRAVKYLILIA